MTEDILSFVLIPLQPPPKKTQNVISPPQTGWMNACFPYTFKKLQKSNHFEEELKQKNNPMIPNAIFRFWWTIQTISRSRAAPPSQPTKWIKMALEKYVGSRLGSVKCRYPIYKMTIRKFNVVLYQHTFYVVFFWFVLAVLMNTHCFIIL